MKMYVLCAVFVCLIVAAECGSKSEGLEKKIVKKNHGGKATIITDCTKSVNKDFEGYLDAFNGRDFKKWATYYHKDYYQIALGTPSLLSNRQSVNFYKYFLTRNPMTMIKFSITEVFCMDARSAVGTCIFQSNFKPGTFGRASMVWIKDKRGIWKMFKETVDGADMPQSLPELQYHWNKNGMVNTYKDNETVEINYIDSPKDPFYKVMNGKLVDA